MLRGRAAVIAGALVIAVASGITAGCGGDKAASNPPILDPVAAAATKTQNAGAARIRMSMAFSGPHGKTLRTSGAGAMDGTRSELSFRLGSMLGGMGAPPAVTKKLMHSSLKEVALVEHGDFVVYMQLGFLQGQLPGGKQWIKIDFSKVGKSAGVDLGKLLSGNQFEPGDMLGMLKAEGAKVTKVGAATVDGTSTTRYRVRLDLAKALEAKGLTSPLLSAAAAQTKTVSDDVWVGKDGLLRRIQMHYGMPESGRPVHMAMTMDLYDYGAHVTIAAPPSSEVFDGTQLAQQGVNSSLP